MTAPTKYLQSDTVFSIVRKRKYLGPYGRMRTEKYTALVRPVDGEVHFNDVGFSHGFVHFADPVTGEKLGYCGVCYFEDNATPVADEIIGCTPTKP